MNPSDAGAFALLALVVALWALHRANKALRLLPKRTARP